MARPTIGITALVIALICVPLAPLEHSASGQAKIGSGLGGFEAWLNLARQHEPGRIDAALKLDREIQLERHFALIIDLEAFLEFVRNPDLEYLRRARRTYSPTEQAFLKRLAAIERVAGTTDKLLKKIALLESDGVMLTGGQKFILVPPGSRIPKDGVLSADGISLDVVVAPPNWRLARTAIDAISTDPDARRWIHQWYTATTAYLFYDHVLAVIPDHVVAWQRVLPDDGEAWFHEGCLFEAFAGARLQHAMLDGRRKGLEVKVENAYSNLRQARRRFEQALERDPRHVEARLRLARVKSALGETKAAVAEFSAVLPHLGSDRELLYLAQLFLGAAQESSGDYAGARTAYAEAGNLYPSALSPRISQLGMDPPSAGGDDVLADLLRQERIRSDDPWLEYHLGPGRFGPSLATALWAASRAQ
jgi:tetratricopeptide (TPR) repeat protein